MVNVAILIPPLFSVYTLKSVHIFKPFAGAKVKSIKNTKIMVKYLNKIDFIPKKW